MRHAGDRGGSRWWLIALFGLFALRAGVILGCDVVTQDGPNHVATAHVLASYEDVDAYQRYFRIHTEPDPTWLPARVLSALLSLFDPTAAEKAFVLGSWALYCLGCLLVLRGLGGAGLCLLPFALPYAFGFPFHMGFYGYQLAVALFLLAWGLFLGARPDRPFGWTRASLFGLCALGSVASHPLPLAALVGFVGLVGIQRAASRDWRWCVPPIAFLLPALVLFGRYVASSAELPKSAMPPRTRASFFLHDVLGSHDLELAWMGAGWQVLLLTGVAAGVWGARRHEPHPMRWPLFAFAFCGALTVALVPEEALRGRLIATRLQALVALGCIAFLGTFPLRAWLARSALVLGSLGVVAFTWSDAVWYRRVAPYRHEYLSAAQAVPTGQTLLALPLTLMTVDEDGAPLSDRVRPFVHLSALAAAEHGFVDLSNLQAAVEYNPVQYRATLDPYRLLAVDTRLESVPPRIDLAGYHERTEASVDYVLLWQLEQSRIRDEQKAALLEQLAGYELVRVSEPHGMARLYRRRGPSR